MEEEYKTSKTLRIPKGRIKVLAGCLKKIEKAGNVKIEINDEIMITGNSYDVFNAHSVVSAIGRGFSFDDAAGIFEGKSMYVVPISKEKKALCRIRSRIIGTRGKAKRKIENTTGTKISVYGKTVSIIGEGEGLENARTAVEDLISGRSHSFVFKFLESKNKD